jgi:glycosyltransferase involved in cell wall biosynthesis
MADLFPAMTSAGWDVQYALASGAKYNIPDNFMRRHKYICNPHILDGRVGTPDRRQRAIIGALGRINPDIVMPITIGDAMPAVREFKCRGGKVRMVVPVHSHHLGLLSDIINNSDIVDAIGVVGGLLYEWARDMLPVPRISVHRIKNGANRSSNARHPCFSEVLRVGFVGRMEAEVQKRVLDLIPILGALSTYRRERISLTVVGGGPACQRLVQGLGELAGFHKIRLLGVVDRDYLYNRIYPDLDCILLTSEEEAGGPLVLIEAMQHGVVPVSSRFIGHATEGLLLPERNCLTFPIGDAAAAASCLERLGRDRILLAQLSSNAICSSTDYNKSNMVNGWIETCRSVLDLEMRVPCKRYEIGSGKVYGRLDQLYLPGAVVDTIRRARGKWFSYGSGYGEWPGSLNTDGELDSRMGRRLKEIEASRSSSLYSLTCVQTSS